MAIFGYKAMTPDGRLVRGELEAINLVDLEMRLRRMELDFINGQPIRHHALFRPTPAPRRELINFCFHLEQLTRAGVPILEGLADLRDSTEHPRFREVVAGVVEGIEGGRSLSQSLEDYPQAFDPVFCNLVRAGETSGNLPHVLRELASALKREDELAAYARKLTIYPAIVGTIILAAISVSLIYVVPELARLFRSTGQSLPLQTRLLIGLSAFLRDYWWLVLGSIVGLTAGIRLSVERLPSARLRYDALLLRLPLLGNIRRKIVLARFANLFAMMYASGIPIIQALHSAERVVGNRVIQNALERVGERIGQGQNVSTSFAATALFPPLVTRMLRVGENTGALDTALANVSYFYDRDVQEATERLQTMIEPMLTLILGSILLWIMMAVLGPVYDIITQLPV